MDVYFGTTRNPQLVARLPARGGITPKTALHLLVDMDRAHFFEIGEFGVRIA